MSSKPDEFSRTSATGLPMTDSSDAARIEPLFETTRPSSGPGATFFSAAGVSNNPDARLEFVNSTSMPIGAPVLSLLISRAAMTYRSPWTGKLSSIQTHIPSASTARFQTKRRTAVISGLRKSSVIVKGIRSISS